MPRSLKQNPGTTNEWRSTVSVHGVCVTVTEKLSLKDGARRRRVVKSASPRLCWSWSLGCRLPGSPNRIRILPLKSVGLPFSPSGVSRSAAMADLSLLELAQTYPDYWLTDCYVREYFVTRWPNCLRNNHCFVGCLLRCFYRRLSFRVVGFGNRGKTRTGFCVAYRCIVLETGLNSTLKLYTGLSLNWSELLTVGHTLAHPPLSLTPTHTHAPIPVCRVGFLHLFDLNTIFENWSDCWLSDFAVLVCVCNFLSATLFVRFDWTIMI